MEIPIYIDERKQGTVTLTRVGNRWQAEAVLDDLGRVARLNIYGAKGSVYLGIPEPDGTGKMRLSRVLSAMAEEPGYCGEIPRDKPKNKTADTPPPKSTVVHVVWMGGKAYYF